MLSIMPPPLGDLPPPYQSCTPGTSHPAQPCGEASLGHLRGNGVCEGGGGRGGERGGKEGAAFVCGGARRGRKGALVAAWGLGWGLWWLRGPSTWGIRKHIPCTACVVCMHGRMALRAPRYSQAPCTPLQPGTLHRRMSRWRAMITSGVRRAVAGCRVPQGSGCVAAAGCGTRACPWRMSISTT